MSVQCLHGDCLELMKTLPDNSIDLFLCDLPYGCLHSGGKSQGRVFNSEPIAWDKRLDMQIFWEQVKRLCKNDHTPVIMFADFRFGNHLYNSNPKWFRHEIVLNKVHATNAFQVHVSPLKAHEFILVFSKKLPTYNNILDEGGRNVISIVTFKRLWEKRHPTAKKVVLYKWLISRYSHEGDTVLDPTAGSFNSGRACQELNRKYIGIEADDKFFNENHL